MPWLRQRLHRWSASLPAKIVKAEANSTDRTQTPLFERYHVSTSMMAGEEVTCYLHHYLRSDPDGGLHDHPWNWAVAWPLCGGYVEERFAGLGGGRFGVRFINRRPGIPYKLTGDDFHRLILNGAETSWSLFWTGATVKDWGFLDSAQVEAIPGQRPSHDVVPRQPFGLIYTPVDSKQSGSSRWWLDAPTGAQIDRAAP